MRGLPFGRPRSRTRPRSALLCAGALAVLACAGLVRASPAQASQATQATPAADAEAAARMATDAGYRTGVAVLNLATGAYAGAGEDTATFASESVVKVLIATQLLLSGQMTGATEQTAYEMITRSDDDAANALYGLAGGDDVVSLVAQHYGIADLGSGPSRPGWWGNTHLTASGLVHLYAAIAADPTVGPWLQDAMAHATEYGADGTYQFFGLPSATTGAAVKQGWGADGDDSSDAVFNSTGYVNGGRYAVAILTEGPPSSYGSRISAIVTAQARALLPGGSIDDPAAHDPTVSGVAVTSAVARASVSGTATDPDQPAGGLVVRVTEGGVVAAIGTTAGDGSFALSFPATVGAHTYAVTVTGAGEGAAEVTVPAGSVTVPPSAPRAGPTSSAESEPASGGSESASGVTVAPLVRGGLYLGLLAVAVLVGFAAVRHRGRRVRG